MPFSGPALEHPIHLPTLLRRVVEASPDKPALVSLEARWTWRDLDQVTDRLAANLLSLGLQSGDRVASLMPNRTALVLHYLACLKAGLVATPLNYRYVPPEIDHALEVSGASLLLAHAERDDDIAASKLAGKLPLGVISYGGKDERSSSFETLCDRQPANLELPSPAPDDPAFIFFTSGSTGLPKGVTHSFASFGWMVASAIQGLELTPQDVMLPGSSLSHIGGSLSSLAALAAGARVIVARTFDACELLPLLRDERPTILVMLPAALFSLVRDHDAAHKDFASLKLCLSGGDKVAAKLEQEFADLTGLCIDESYGMTEIGFAAVNPPSGVNKPGSVGCPFPGFSMSIRDEGGVEVAQSQQGRLWVKSPSNMVEYWNAPEATKITLQDGWLDTGDIMRVDAEGYLWFCGRKKQIIVHDASNISPQEVEEALLEHAAVESAGVVGVHDLVHGENVRAYITLRQGAKRPTSQELIHFAHQRIGYKAPEEIVVLPEMPLNATGKVDRVRLKKMAEEHDHELTLR
ncbi:class I adenylate-forming enzyme family protein [Gloeobacter morelensis]|uniref:Acyl--CoA ligase n=1 Tax=Gloeobacter morelensis MG652769 TaxID=2781736 RepID=A0ABY3PJ16_9CYAN|nr:class I adenylate-forming enzyme family protein [Gloeobacter morelensis]UFP93661.1 acyl--CoA ligase [Gloeobacter morelensis MG652769]